MSDVRWMQGGHVPTVNSARPRSVHHPVG